MGINKISILICFGVLSFGTTTFGQTLTNKPIFETKSIKVVTNEKFPQDMESEIFVGSFVPFSRNGTPYFRTEGKTNQVEKFSIETSGDGPSVSLLQKEGETNSYVLSLFTEDSEGKVLMFLDFNLDGVWDVKRTPTREQKNYIFFQGQWLAVDRIGGLLSKTPNAKSGNKQFVFQGTWKSSN